MDRLPWSCAAGRVEHELEEGAEERRVNAGQLADLAATITRKQSAYGIEVGGAKAGLRMRPQPAGTNAPLPGHMWTSSILIPSGSVKKTA